MRDKLQSTRSHTGFQPDWMSFEVHEALAAIAGEHVYKKEATVLHMAQAIATGQPVNAVFKRPDTCGKKVWYGFDDKPGWRDDPAIAHALDVAISRARWWVRVKGGKAIESALDVLVDAGEVVASQLVRIAIEGRAQVTNTGGTAFVEADVKDIIKAADSVLDRIDKKTASKSSTEVGGEQVIRLTWGEAEMKTEVADGE